MEPSEGSSSRAASAACSSAGPLSSAAASASKRPAAWRPALSSTVASTATELERTVPSGSADAEGTSNRSELSIWPSTAAGSASTSASESCTCDAFGALASGVSGVLAVSSSTRSKDCVRSSGGASCNSSTASASSRMCEDRHELSGRAMSLTWSPGPPSTAPSMSGPKFSFDVASAPSDSAAEVSPSSSGTSDARPEALCRLRSS
mmetsp:Transcript_48185/g.104359  ORF Transcript_48185/g.104359 Transcript_48185/m.104359 type:complete len:206 (-) Transcript_48185:1880-2497(-)